LFELKDEITRLSEKNKELEGVYKDNKIQITMSEKDVSSAQAVSHQFCQW
jgi:hypothetical protein